MKKIVITLSGIIILIVLVLGISYTIDLGDKKIIINGTTYALTIDGELAQELPASGNYLLDSYTCEKGSTITWDGVNHDLYIEGSGENNDSCELNFTTAYTLLNTMQVGDYVAYVGNNGCNNGVAGTTGGDAAEAGNSCLGENANQSIDENGTYGYCNNSNRRFTTYGWRIAYIDNNKVHLVSAGAPACVMPDSPYALSTVSDNKKQNGIIFLILDIEFDVLTFINDINSLSLNYCNPLYVDNNCNSQDAWAMGNSDFQKVTYAISGISSNLVSDYGTPYCSYVYSKASCGYGNDLIDNGGYYWFAANSSTDGVSWHPNNQFVGDGSSDSAYGLRPIISLSSSVYVTGGSGTMEDPYTISNDYE